jgi:Ca-activated chloride channel family protein
MKVRVFGFVICLLVSIPPSFSQGIQNELGNAVASKDILSALGPTALTIEKKVQEVNLILSVTDQKGHFVQGLSPSDLTILDNDRKQTALTFFQSQTELPLHVAFVLDVSASVAERFEVERHTIESFLKQVTSRQDSVMLFAFNQSVQIAAPVMNNWKTISRRLRTLKPNGETALYDAVTTASRWLAQGRRPARRIIILISDGEENASKASLDSTVADVLRSETTVYSVNVINSFSESTEYGEQGMAVLKQLSDATGGSYLRASADGDVGPAFGKIRRELRSQYAVAYKPSNIAEQFFHRLKVIAARNLRVRCRTGYYVR